MERDKEREFAVRLRGKLTLEEKIGMIHGAQLFATKGVERLGIPSLVMSDGPMGVRQEFEPDCWKSIGNSDDYVTYLPCNSALASTWNRRLAFAMGSVLGAEARGRGKDVILAPGINIKRSPLCGRNFEYFSEDPYLTGELAVPFIQGVQRWDVAACVKHFAANNQETERLWVDVEADERDLREIYLPAFYDCLIKGGSLSVMGAYNRLRGEHCCQSGYLLDEILRKEWGYDGAVISDWGGVHDTELAANSQLDIEMSVTDNFDEYFLAEPLKKAVMDGKIPESAVDEKVERILLLMMRLHMIGEGKEERKGGVYNAPEHRKTALEVAEESIVLLKNEKGRLPLQPEKVKKLLLIGENAEKIHSNGGGSAEIKALYEISPLMGIKMLLGGNVRVDYVKGYESGLMGSGGEDGFAGGGNEGGSMGDGEGGFAGSGNENGLSGSGNEGGLMGSGNKGGLPESGMNWQARSLQNGGGHILEDSGHAVRTEEDEKRYLAVMERRKELCFEAGERAKDGEYDEVIFIGGLNHDFDSEGVDRKDMKLPYGQDELIKELLAVRPDMVVSLIGGSPVEMGQWIDNARAVLWAWYGGMEGGYALAKVLFGQTSPSGKLPETFYKTHTDCSAHCIGEFGEKEKAVYKEGIFVGYRYNETFGVAPQFCFGHGLSYTEFTYRDAEYKEEEGDGWVVCTVANTGARAGAETVQIYRVAETMKDGNPAKELIGFEKIWLQPGGSGEVRIALRNKVEKGCKLGVGGSVGDIRVYILI